MQIWTSTPNKVAIENRKFVISCKLAGKRFLMVLYSVDLQLFIF